MKILKQSKTFYVKFEFLAMREMLKLFRAIAATLDIWYYFCALFVELYKNYEIYNYLLFVIAFERATNRKPKNRKVKQNTNNGNMYL